MNDNVLYHSLAELASETAKKQSNNDLDGVFHCVEVEAASIYEASVLALSAFSKHEWIEAVERGSRSR